jgi:hypothetical protein
MADQLVGQGLTARVVEEWVSRVSSLVLKNISIPI